jgi:hypothetical protein
VSLKAGPFNRRNFRFKPDVALLPAIDPESTDIIVYMIPKCENPTAELKIYNREELLYFIKRIKQSPRSRSQYLFLIQDISQGVIDGLEEELGFPASVAEEHVKGRVNGESSRPERTGLHSERLASNLFGASSAKSDITSVSWWRLLSQSKEGRRREEKALNESKADASKIVAPVFPIKLQETATEDTDERHDWNWNDMKHPIRFFNAFKRQLTFPVEDIQDTIFKLDCHTYRPHQVITEVKDQEWGSASEERMTFFKITRDGSDYCKPEFLCFVKNRFRRLT